MKYIDFKRYKFSTILKYLDRLRYNFLKKLQFKNLKKYNFKNFTKNLDFKRFNFYKIIKQVEFNNYKYLPVYFIISTFFIGLIYLSIPIFYNYDKSTIEKKICANKNIQCEIKGKINYTFYPTPRIKIKSIIIKDLFDKKQTFISAENVSVNLFFKNLLDKKKQKYKKVKLNNFLINFNMKNVKNYKDIFKKEIDYMPIVFDEGKIVFLDGKKYIVTINKTNIEIDFLKDSISAKLKGKFLNDNIYFKLNSDKKKAAISSKATLKLSNLNLLIKADLNNNNKKKNITSGNVLIKKGKTAIAAIIEHKDNEITINKSNLRNAFAEGKLSGKIKLLPYFGFNLDLDLNSINFTKLYNQYLSLDRKKQKKLFKINNKVNGKINLFSNKIYSNNNIVKSLESRIELNNGNILVEQFLLNLGKLGAADMIGIIENDNKSTGLKFESNIFVDNEKKFLSKFGIYNKKTISSNIFVSGNLDLENPKASFYEISDNNKLLANEDIDFIENEFNDFMFEEGYSTLFRLPKFKNFIKSITSEIN